MNDQKDVDILFWPSSRHFPNYFLVSVFKEMGFDLWNGNPNYASLPLPGTGKREGREYTKPFQQLSSHPFRPHHEYNASPAESKHRRCDSPICRLTMRHKLACHLSNTSDLTWIQSECQNHRIVWSACTEFTLFAGGVVTRFRSLLVTPPHQGLFQC